MGEPAKKLDPEAEAMWRALLAAPLSEEPETEEERAAIESVQADVRGGRRWHSAEEIHALIDDLPSE